MGKLKFTFTNIFLWVGIIAAALLFENVTFLTSSATKGLTDFHFYLLFSVAILSFISLITFEVIFNKTKVDYFLIGLIGIILLAGFVAIATYKDLTFSNDITSLTVHFEPGEKIRFALSFLVFGLTIYSIFLFFGKYIVTHRRMWFFYLALILICIGLCIYSYFIEQDMYKIIFSGDFDHARGIKSGFWNENAFAATLLLGMGAAILLNAIKKNPLSYLMLIVFMIQIIFTTSIISIAIAVALVVCYFFIEIMVAFKKHKKRSFIFLAIYLVLVIGIGILLIFSLTNSLGWFSSFANYIYKQIRGIDYSTFSHRLYLWEASFNLLKRDPIKLVFGYGPGISESVLLNYVIINEQSPLITLTTAHNGYVQIFFNYGILGLLFYGIIIGYFFYSVIKWLFKDTRYALLTGLVGMSLFTYAIIESIFLFNNNVQGLVIGAFFYLPIMFREQTNKKTKFVNEIKFSKNSIEPREVRLFPNLIILVIAAMLAMLLPMLSLPRVYDDMMILYIVLICIVSLLEIIFMLPLITHYLLNNTSRKIKLLNLIINSAVLILSLASGVFLISYYIPFSINYLYLIPTFVITLLLIDFVIVYLVRNKKAGAYETHFRFVLTNVLPGVLGSSGIVILLSYLLDSYFVDEPLTYVILAVASCVIYLIINFAVPNKDLLSNLSYNGKRTLLHIKKSFMKLKEGERKWKKESR